MVSANVAEQALKLSPEDRLELARLLVESVVSPSPISEPLKEGIRRIEEVSTGQVQGLSEEEYRAALE
jgi:putative addiction module component (TIGR02574 family)